MNLPTIIVCIVLAAIVGLIIYKMVKDKKQGKSSCGGSCGSCPMGGCCHGSQVKNKR
ncbi:MAG: FeoB-associated Cys-rich membrane protein [Firmicutes bacterium]|nr:FeoB-associated Cys-rich membrane protein [[Eubacterium] siraeum]MCM1487340.1 FeoB-associated Cys-rich membrane protein [Bacillota bacterium]